jgi:hypothetical protein
LRIIEYVIMTVATRTTETSKAAMIEN